MIDFILRHCIRDYQNTQNQRVRESYGRLAGIMGIALNGLLFLGKFTVGSLTGSIAIRADAVNNLSDAGSSVISLLSFKLSNKPADAEHPFGHARTEYIASLAVAFLILLLGVELIRSSIQKILTPAETPFSLAATVVLIASIGVKCFMFALNRGLGRRIDSTMMRATAIDSLSDVLATSAVLLSTLISPLLGVSLDGYMGVAVALFILYSGYKVLREATSILLGQAPAQDEMRLIEHHIREYEGVLGVHDMVLHNYGPGRIFATAHVEVDAREDLMRSHDRIDNIEREMAVDHGVHLVLHLDPIVRGDPVVDALRERTRKLLTEIDPSLSMHDFRVVLGETHSNLIFDVTVPFHCPISDRELLSRIIARVRAMDATFYAVVTLDRAYTGSPSNKAQMN